ncbi:alpha,alpha-trehalose-phosphate synthase (UDP-forming) [Allopusillimonas soli]|uniref:Trehalose-6-phosphate synthase n=1 Tax=Allopusillimonas soli TaxID=659016 RepID=A0A853FIN2_9BURK|nr:alpha,alpha-trehalose-phosphate synthase (UDP-forming) [Allopusillimonas soli]NYT38600.1 alpha,alpha-trehalose-phosphate synthase (UDP-forming) [Allopusillimonas soli]TEA71686.1 alpha,alpha-trehalose-phosphate synthase (UDP-forming) [Allopusillimonas soli]
MARILIVSNRVAPITEGQVSTGGLAVGVLDALKKTGGIWMGWNGSVGSKSGDPCSQDENGNISQITWPLSQRDYDTFYRGFANGVLWPAFHFRSDLIHFRDEDYEGYRRVNRLFAEQIQRVAKPDDLIWIHDYHFLPLAQYCRELGLKNRLGLFLHIPFPSPPIFRTIPNNDALARDMLAYDLVGLQTAGDRRALHDYCERCLGASSTDGAITLDGKVTRTGVYPIGVCPEDIQHLAQEHKNSREVVKLKSGLQHRRLIISVDRLDYSKGLIERFRGFERLLDTRPRFRGAVSFVQIAPPSRTDVHGYRSLRQMLEQTSGRINARWTELSWTPIRYMNRSFDRPTLMSFFRASQVGLVTSLRDGMNLVAKEYVAAQSEDDPGVLVLSEFAGAADELAEGALIINPHDTSSMSKALQAALDMHAAERRQRHQTMMQVLKKNDLIAWRERFLSDLENPPSGG